MKKGLFIGGMTGASIVLYVTFVSWTVFHWQLSGWFWFVLFITPAILTYNLALKYSEKIAMRENPGHYFAGWFLSLATVYYAGARALWYLDLPFLQDSGFTWWMPLVFLPTVLFQYMTVVRKISEKNDESA